jgi:1-acyl-sn-glycerol-3-phosphate acyltransferase
MTSQQFLPDERGKWLKSAWYRFGRMAVQAYAGCMFNMDVKYQAPLTPGPKILAANHPSTSDPILMTTLAREPVRILIIETLYKIPLIGASLKWCGHIRVSRCNGKAALEEGIRRLNAGQTLGIFPEGEISPGEGRFQRSHTGVARLAVSSGAPVIPIGIYLDASKLKHIDTPVDGTHETGTWYTHGAYSVTVGAPMHFRGDPEDRPHMRAITDEIMRKIAALSTESARRMVIPRPHTFIPAPNLFLPALIGLIYRALSIAGRMI